MIVNPLKVACPSCGANFHIPTHLVRGKVVNFRCKKCRGTIAVDGRALTAATPAPFPNPNALSGFPGESMPEARGPLLSIIDGVTPNDGLPSTTGLHVDTPAAFSHSSAPTPRTPPDSFAVASRTPALGVLARASSPPPALLRSDAAIRRQASLPSPSSSGRNKKMIGGIAVVIAAGLTLWSVSVRRPSRTVAPATTTAAEHARSTPLAPANDLRGSPDPARAVGNAGPGEGAKQTLPVVSPVKTAEPTPTKATRKPRAPKSPPSEPVEGAPTETATAAELSPVSPPATAAAQEAVSAPSQEIDFNKDAARQALEDAGQLATVCRTIDTPSGSARIAVTFAPSGTVTSAIVESGPFVGTPAGSCVASKFRSVRVPAFTGDPVTVHKTVPF